MEQVCYYYPKSTDMDGIQSEQNKFMVMSVLIISLRSSKASRDLPHSILTLGSMGLIVNQVGPKLVRTFIVIKKKKGKTK